MKAKKLPPISVLRTRLQYNPKTGDLVWKFRPREDFPTDHEFGRWNTRYAGKCAFSCINTNGYRHGRIDNKSYRAHRVAWAIFHGKDSKHQIDHINGNRSDNRIENLREAPGNENRKNQKARKSKSGITGVHRADGKWCATITSDGKTHQLGRFYNLSDAIAARAAAEVRYGFSARHGI